MRVSLGQAEFSAANSKTCRLCLRVENRLTEIFADGETSERLRSCILDCCPITLVKDSKLPNGICCECESKVVATYEFREQCRKTERTLLLYWASRYVNVSASTNALQCKTVQDCSVQTEVYTLRREDSDRQEHNNENQETFEDVQVLSRISCSSENRERFSCRGGINETSNVQHEKRKSIDSKLEIVCEETEEEESVLECLHPRQPQLQTLHLSRLERRRIEEGKNEKKEVESIEPSCSERKISVFSGKNHNETNESDHRDSSTVENVKSPNNSRIQYLCDVCSKTFASKSGFRFHLRSHNGAKPHLCRYCGKGFAIASYAKRHEQIHIGEKPFACHLCSATFGSPNGLKYHLRLHTGEAHYSCKYCGKSFYRRKYLKEHVFTHTGEKPYVCKACGASYGNSGSLFVHKKRCNSEQANTSLPTSTS